MVITAAELRNRKRYWKRVSMCLVAFHKYQPAKADEMVTDLQKRFPLKSTSPIVELIYHEEPFRLACKLTHSKMSVKSHAQKYQQILDDTANSPVISKPRKYRMLGEKLKDSLKSQLEVREDFETLENVRKTLPAAAAVGKVKKSPDEKKTASTSRTSDPKKPKKKPVKKATSSRKRTHK